MAFDKALTDVLQLPENAGEDVVSVSQTSTDQPY